MSTVDDAIKELICPISLELPVDPVTSEDGQIYERESIAAHIARQGAALRSPVTNAPMGAKLFPAKQVRNLIDIMVRSGAITGDNATCWTERIGDEAVVAGLRRKAEGGDADALHMLGTWHCHGEHGLAADNAAGFRWLKRAADLHHVGGMAVAGFMLANGKGVARNETHGVALTTRAAEMGSDFAAFVLGELFANGENGLPQDNVQATYWLSKAISGSCPLKHLGEFNAEAAAALLEGVRGRVLVAVAKPSE